MSLVDSACIKKNTYCKSSLGVLTRKKQMIYAANVADFDLATGNAMVDKLKEVAEKEGARTVISSAQVEAELVELEEAIKVEFLESLGVSLKNCSLWALLVREDYDLLDLQTPTQNKKRL